MTRNPPLTMLATCLALFLLPASADVALAETPERFRPAQRDDSAYTETYTFSADFSNGGFAQVHLGVTNVGPGSGRAVCRIFVEHPAAKWKSQLVASSKEWNYEQKPKPQLQIGSCVIHDGDRPVIIANSKEGQLRLTLHEPLRTLIPEGNRWTDGKDFHETRVYALAATATALLTPAKGSPRSEEVRVYVEHNDASVTPDKVGRQWFRFRTTDENPVRTALMRRDGATDLGEGWLLDNAGKSRHVRNVHIEATGEPGAAPMTFHIGARTIVLRPISAPASYAPLRDMGLVGRLLAAIVGDPLITAVDVEWAEGTEKRLGRLEISTFR